MQRWLSDIPVQDPVDRRNAPFLQVLLIFLGVFIPLNKSLYLYAVLSGRWSADLPPRSAMLADLTWADLVGAAGVPVPPDAAAGWGDLLVARSADLTTLNAVAVGSALRYGLDASSGTILASVRPPL